MKYILIPVLARNVIFSKKSEELFDKLITKAANSNVKDYINKTFRTWLINEYPTNRVHIQKPDDPDWVAQAINRGDTIYDINLSNTDENKYLHWIDYLNTLPPTKVIKISVSQLEKQVTDWDKKLENARRKSHIETTDGAKVIKSYPNGYTWVELTGKDALVLEGNIMGHCVGGEDYIRQVANGKTRIFSLRDRKNQPHVTIEYGTYGNIVNQIKGKSNNPPVVKYHPLIINFINNELKPKKIDETDVQRMGLFLSEDGTKILSLEDFKGDTLKIKEFNPIISDSITSLPNIESNSIELERVSLQSIGNMHTVIDNIAINDSNIESIKDISSNYSVHIYDSKIGVINNIECINFEVSESSIKEINILKCENAHIDGSIKTIKQLYADTANITSFAPFGIETEFHIETAISLKGNTFYIGNNSEINKLYSNSIKSLLVIGDNVSIDSLSIYNVIPQKIKIGKNVSIEKLDIAPRIENPLIIKELKKAKIKQYNGNNK